MRQALVPAIAIALAIAGWPMLRDRVRRHPYFAVREVLVRCHGRLTAEAVRAASGIEPGMSIWDVDGAAAAARIRREPWVRAAHVRRELPHRIVIQVRELHPVAILAVGDRLYYVAGNGRVFAPVGASDPHDLAYITGLTEADLDGPDACGPHAIRRALALLRVVGRSSGGPLGAVSEIHVDRRRGLTLLPVRPTVPIEVGWDDFPARIARLPAVLAQWDGRENGMAAVSLLFDDEVIVRTRPAGRRGNRS